MDLSATASESVRAARRLLPTRAIAEVTRVSPSTVQSWASGESTPRDGAMMRLQILAAALGVIDELDDDPDHGLRWIRGPLRPGSSSTVAATLGFPVLHEGLLDDVVTSARRYVDARSNGPRVEAPPARRRDNNTPRTREAAAAFLELSRSSLRSGQLGERRDDVVLVRPADAVEHARLRASERSDIDPAVLSARNIGLGLVELGAGHTPGHTTSVRKIGGSSTRVWEVPVSLL